ncbi:MAG: 2Fe-2S iron-sulfur cluster binding domain-containing protein [Acidimicrobiales bacterium]
MTAWCPSASPSPSGRARRRSPSGGRSTILQSARSGGFPVPSSCEAGHCATCMAQVIEGRVEMAQNDILTAEEVAEGWVLTCQAVPVSSVVRVVYET